MVSIPFKAFVPIYVILSGSIISLRLSQLLNALGPREVTLCAKVTFTNLSQLLKASLPIEVTPSGIVISSISVPQNARAPIVFRVLGKDTVCKLSFPLNA